ncbi:MAG: DUF1822 family protein [Okeania sp. SIO3B5]|uniref:DUF1822 family protein n=1 Tax=Okeania sp. SIO3B5 TaxID=2607811 RepID=UPI001400E713|nr:DUF1822 family protein [Okeania sp. SIO3B5]NEO53036.1 DUF1822 family protein [Okeania sp. SIO3B5]
MTHETFGIKVPITRDAHNHKVPITRDAHNHAEEFAAEQISPNKRAKVYLNTLSVCAVRNFLNIVQIETDVELTGTWNPIERAFSDVADLFIPNLEVYLECRPVLPEQEVVVLPEEVKEDRIGYVFVKFDNDLQEAELLGFFSSVELDENRDEINLEELKPLEDLLTVLYDEQINQINSYRERLEKLLDDDWVEPKKILVSSGRRGRGNANQLSKQEQSSAPFMPLKRGKIIELDNQRFALIIEIKQGRENEEMKLYFQLLPCGETTKSLPSGLELTLLKPSGKVINSTTAKTGGNQLIIPLNINKSLTTWLEKLEGNREKGKLYQVQITLKGKSKTETFPSIQPVA